MSMGNLAMLSLDQLVDVGTNIGSRYAQSILEERVYLILIFIGFYVKHVKFTCFT